MVRSDRVMNEAVLLIALVFLNVLHTIDTQITPKKTYFRMRKLCSRQLSDALYIVCRERGYNEPFTTYSSEDQKTDPGPGLVEECCYHQCTYNQLEQYCKPAPSEEKRIDAKDDVKDQSYKANLPHSTTEDLLERHPEMDYTGDTIKRKIDDIKTERHKRGKNGRNIGGKCKGKADVKKQRGRHCRCRRRHLECRRTGKVSHSNL